jgi:hypothetical protein
MSGENLRNGVHLSYLGLLPWPWPHTAGTKDRSDITRSRGTRSLTPGGRGGPAYWPVTPQWRATVGRTGTGAEPRTGALNPSAAPLLRGETPGGDIGPRRSRARRAPHRIDPTEALHQASRHAGPPTRRRGAATSKRRRSQPASLRGHRHERPPLLRRNAIGSTAQSVTPRAPDCRCPRCTPALPCSHRADHHASAAAFPTWLPSATQITSDHCCVRASSGAREGCHMRS